VETVKGNTDRAAMRGADAPSGSKTSSRTKGMRRNLGYLLSGRWRQLLPVRVGKVRSRSRR
jgi:hypothetical protein